MAWNRVYQLAAENQSLVKVVTYNGAAATVSPTVSSDQKRTGAYSYRCGDTLSARAFGITTPSTVNVRTNYALYHTTPNLAAAGLPLYTINVDGAYLHVVWLNDGTINLRAGYDSDTINLRWPIAAANAAPILSTTQWHDIGLAAYFHASAGYVSLYVNGAPILNWTGDTQLYRSTQTIPRTNILGVYVLGGGYVLSTGVSGGSYWGQYAYADDFYIDTGSGEIDLCPTSRYFHPTYPIADATPMEFTPNTGDAYTAIADAPPDNATTYIKAGGADLTALFTYSEFTLPTDHAVRAVIIDPYAQKTDASIASTLKTVAKYDGQETVSAEKDLTTIYSYDHSERMELAPDGAAWTTEKVNATTRGIRSSGVYS